MWITRTRRRMLLCALSLLMMTASGFLAGIVSLHSVHGEILTVPNHYLGNLAVMDSLHGYAYFSAYSTGSSSNAEILKIRLSDFTYVGTLGLPSDIGIYPAQFVSAVIDPANDFAYFATADGKIVRINLSDFSTFNVLSLSLGQPGLGLSAPSAIDPIHGFAYFVANTTIVRILLSDFKQTSSLILSQESGISSALIDIPAGFAYFGVSNQFTSQVAKVRLSDFTFNGTLTLGATTPAAIIDSADGFAYYATYDQKIVRVNLSSFSTVGDLTLDIADSLTTAALDSVGGIGFFGGYRGKIVEVRLSDLTLVRSLNFSGAGYSGQNIVADTTTRFAYFGGYDYSSQRGSIIRVSSDTQNQPPIAIIGSDGSSYYGSSSPCQNLPCYAQRPIAFDASRSFDPDGHITDYFWLFGDGENAVGLAANHTYTRSGTFIVTLRVTDDQGVVRSSSQTIEVHPLPVVRQGVTSGNYARYAVSVNDTSFPFSPELTDQTKTVGLNVTSVSGSKLTVEWADSLRNGMTVTFPQSADILFTGASQFSSPPSAPRTNLFLVRPDLRTGDPIWLDGGGIMPFGVTGTRQEFLLGDTRAVAFVNQTYWLSGQGRFSIEWDQASGVLVRASVSFKRDALGPTMVDEISLNETNIWQPNLPPTARFGWTTPTPIAGQPVVFDASSSADADGTVSSYLWDFGDGGTSTDRAASHTYRSDTGGTFTVRLTVHDDDGAIATEVREVSVAARLERCGGVRPCLIDAKGRISDVKFTANMIHFVVNGESGTTGFANVTIPRSAVPDAQQLKNSVFLMSGEGARTKLQSSMVTLTSNSTHYFLYFPITFHSSVTVEIELPQQIAWGLVIAGAGAAAVAVVAISSSFLYLRRMRRQNRAKPSAPTNEQLDKSK